MKKRCCCINEGCVCKEDCGKDAEKREGKLKREREGKEEGRKEEGGKRKR